MATSTRHAADRRALWGAALAAPWLLGACSTPATPAPPAAWPAAAEVGVPVEVAAGVYMLRGATGEAAPENAGRVGNAGFVVGPAGVVCIDSGTSYQQGVALLASIRRVTALPVRLLLLTHTRQEFLFGAAAFAEQRIPVQMQTQAARLMAARCEGCLKTLKRLLGEEAMRGTTVVKPDILFDASRALDLIGRPLRLLYFGHSSGPGDVAVLDERSGVLFAGGLLDQDRIPDVQDADLPGWHRALAALGSLPLRRIVPGHGPVAGPGLVGTVARYLHQLESRAQALVKAGAALSEVAAATHLPHFEGWDQYETIHRRNAAVVFLRLEQALLAL